MTPRIDIELFHVHLDPHSFWSFLPFDRGPAGGSALFQGMLPSLQNRRLDFGRRERMRQVHQQYALEGFVESLGPKRVLKKLNLVWSVRTAMLSRRRYAGICTNPISTDKCEFGARFDSLSGIGARTKCRGETVAVLNRQPVSKSPESAANVTRDRAGSFFIVTPSVAFFRSTMCLDFASGIPPGPQRRDLHSQGPPAPG